MMDMRCVVILDVTVDSKWLLIRQKWLLGHQTDCCLAPSGPRCHSISARCKHRFVAKQERRWAAEQSARSVALHWAKWLVVAQQAVRAHDESKTSIDEEQVVQQPQRLHRLPQTRSESGQCLEGTTCAHKKRRFSTALYNAAAQRSIEYA